MSKPTVVELGVPETVGDVRRMLKPFADSVELGRRNAPRPRLMLVLCPEGVMIDVGDVGYDAEEGAI